MPDNAASANRFRVDRVSTGVLIVVLVLAGVIAYEARPWERANDDSASLGLVGSPSVPRPGEIAPDFALQREDGSILRLSDLRGTPVFLNFWATWCSFCKEEMPDMQHIADAYHGQIVVLGINAGDSIEEGSRFARQIGADYELVYDPDQEVTRGYQVRAMPTSYFIDEDGRVVEAQFGFMTLDMMQEKVAKLLEESD